MRGELKKLSSLFEKYQKNLIAPEGSVINVFLEVVNDLFKLKLTKEKVRYNPSTKTISLVGGGLIRNELKLHEVEILAHLKGRLGEKAAPRRIV